MKWSMFQAEADAVISLIAQCQGKYVVEVGCFHGVNTVRLADACEKTGKTLLSIDPWNTVNSNEFAYQIFLRNTNGYGVTVIRGDSKTVPLPDDLVGQCAVAVIDGDHGFNGCLGDLRRFYPLLSKTGALAVHDTESIENKTVSEAFEEFLKEVPRPFALSSIKYMPTRDEIAAYQYDRGGITILRRPKAEEFPKAWDRSNPIHGWLTRDEASMLYNTAVASTGAIVEIGSYRGKSTVLLAQAKKTVYAIDPLEPGYSEAGMVIDESDAITFRQNISPYPNVRWLRQSAASCQKPVEQIGLAFIDGTHAYPHPLQDFQAIEPWLGKLAKVAFHDFEMFEGVTKSVNELATAGKIRILDRAHSVLLAELASR